MSILYPPFTSHLNLSPKRFGLRHFGNPAPPRSGGSNSHRPRGGVRRYIRPPRGSQAMAGSEAGTSWAGPSWALGKNNNKTWTGHWKMLGSLVFWAEMCVFYCKVLCGVQCQPDSFCISEHPNNESSTESSYTLFIIHIRYPFAREDPHSRIRQMNPLLWLYDPISWITEVCCFSTSGGRRE